MPGPADRLWFVQSASDRTRKSSSGGRPATAAGLLEALLTMVIRTIARSFVVYLLSECTISAPQGRAFAGARILAFR